MFASSREKSALFALPSTSCASQCRTLHTTINRRGLEDFFDLPENWGETTVKSGKTKVFNLFPGSGSAEDHFRDIWFVTF